MKTLWIVSLILMALLQYGSSTTHPPPMLADGYNEIDESDEEESTNDSPTIKLPAVPYLIRIFNGCSFSCTGTILTKHIIITVYHCVLPKNSTRSNFNLFDNIRVTTRNPTANNFFLPIKNIKLFQERGIVTESTVAFLIMQQPIVFDEFVEPVQIHANKLKKHANVTSMGFGIYKDSPHFNDEKFIIVQRRYKINNNSNDYGKDMSNDFEVVRIVAKAESGKCITNSGFPLIREGKLVGVATQIIGSPTKCNKQKVTFTQIKNLENLLDKLINEDDDDDNDDVTYHV